MRYFVTSNDDRKRTEWQATLRDRGYDVVDEYDSDAIIITLGGDGSILYAARTYNEPTILPVRTGNSKGLKTVVDENELLSALDRLEAVTDEGTYVATEYDTLAAYRNDEQLQSGFTALNEINLHHSSPVWAVIFAVRIHDGGETYEFERVIGDGVLVATAFGSTAYYRSITGGTFSDGFGVAFNNVHTPVTTPDHVGVSTDAVVELEVVESKRASSAVLTRDNAEETYNMAVGEPITVRHSGKTVELVDVPSPNA